jgi:hypothetical protein
MPHTNTEGNIARFRAMCGILAMFQEIGSVFTQTNRIQLDEFESSQPSSAPIRTEP